MFWLFRRQKLRPTQRPTVRPSLEVLEGRALPSAAVIPLTDPSSGAAALSQRSSDQPALPLAARGNTKGAAGQIPAFFNGQSVTINVLQLSDKAAASILANKRPEIDAALKKFRAEQTAKVLAVGDPSKSG